MKIEYESRKGEICFLGSISNILYNYKDEISEASLLANSAGFDLRLFWKEENFFEDFWLECVNFRGADYKKIVELLRRTKKVRLLSYVLRDEEELYGFLVEKITDGIPVMISTDLYNLPYHNEFKKTHFNHIVVIHDVSKGYIGLSDCCPSIINQSFYDNSFKWSDFKTMLDKENQYQVWCIERGKDDIGIECDTFLGDKDMGKSFLAGAAAIRTLSKLYADLSKIFIMTNDKKERLRYQYYLFTGYGGPVVSRRLFTNYLEEKGYMELAKECGELVGKWNVASKNLIRTSVLGDGNYLCAFSDDLLRIADFEEEFENKLIQSKVLAKMI